MTTLHEDAIVIDGLIISNWSREVFEAMHAGGLTTANCTCCVWENFRDTLLNIAQWKRWFVEHGDIIMQVRTATDIRRAKELGKVGILLGWQNTTGIEDRIDTLALFKDLGVSVVQLTYNTQNLVGSGCWEENDGGLSGFGREVVAEMNRLGMLVDLSHVGPNTTRQAILASARPCTYSHVAPRGLFDHPRNKTDEELRFIVDRGGFVGLATYPPFLKTGADTTLEDCVALFDYMVNICGEANVGIGTDFTQNQDEAFFDWLRHDKGYARRMVPSKGTAPTVKGFGSLAGYGGLTRALQAAGWSEARIRGVMGENWLRFLGEALEPSGAPLPGDWRA
ncbi:MAG: membrane dipeptidase [Rhizobiales bacterium]|nr:membrane dipeptidase [Hyphomicrobiales bacterium]